MAENGNGNRGPTWKLIAALCVSIILGIGSYFLTEARTDIKNLQREKVDKETYVRDMQEIKSDLKCLIDMHMKKDRE